MKGQFFIKTIDCLKGMRKIKDGRIDFTFTDIPYNVGMDYEVYKDNLPMKKYFQWIKAIIIEIDRISRFGYAIYIPYKHFWEIFRMIPKKAKIITIKMKSKVILEHKNYVRKDDFNMTQHKHYIATTRPAVKLCKNFWDDISVPDDGFLFKEKRFGEPRHPAPTSLEATRRIIEHFTKKGEKVMDCFIGSGTTAIACKELERKCVGFDLNPRYIKITKERLSSNEGSSLLETIEKKECNQMVTV